MIRLASRVNACIGGFMFIDAPIDPNPLQDWGFTSLVNTVINRRLANPRFNLSTDFTSVSNEVDLQNAQRMLTIRGGNNYVIDDGNGGTATPFPKAHRSGLKSVAVKSENVLDGASILKEWLGEGGVPVLPELSIARAETCLKCPKNGEGDWTTYFTVPAAAVIRRQLTQKDGLELTTPHDSKLGVCTACSCPLKLKVHTPLVHILNHTRPEVLDNLIPECWMKTEKV